MPSLVLALQVEHHLFIKVTIFGIPVQQSTCIISTIGLQMDLVPPSLQLRKRNNSRSNPLQTSHADDHSTENLLAVDIDIKADIGRENPALLIERVAAVQS